jgi:hypothetical protein
MAHAKTDVPIYLKIFLIGLLFNNVKRSHLWHLCVLNLTVDFHLQYMNDIPMAYEDIKERIRKVLISHMENSFHIFYITNLFGSFYEQPLDKSELNVSPSS